MNIICLYWVGDFRGRNFTMNDVECLYDNVRTYIKGSFYFYCLTNSKETFPAWIKPIPLKNNWPGWWSKVELHRPDLPEGRTLYLDLDTHVVNDLQPILDYEGDLVMFKTRIQSRVIHPKLASDRLVKRYQAATMLFDSGTKIMIDLYEKFKFNPGRWMFQYRSEQDVMGDWIPKQPTFPDNWMMKLNHCQDGVIPKECIIVTGQPKTMDFRQGRKFNWATA